MHDRWDDFGYQTQFDLHVFDDTGARHRIGEVKIGQRGLGSGAPSISAAFERLPNDFFSLGQSESYYESLNEIDARLRDRVLDGLRDIAVNDALRSQVIAESITTTSLLRTIKHHTLDRLCRIARGDVELSPYDFDYVIGSALDDPPRLAFSARPHAKPPTNVHVLIGRNGVGKTRCLNGMIRSLLTKSSDTDEPQGRFVTLDPTDDNIPFSNVVSVTFSAFDPFGPLREVEMRRGHLKYEYIGLKEESALSMFDDEPPNRTKNVEDLDTEFVRSLEQCVTSIRRYRWRECVDLLNADPIFKDCGIADLDDTELSDADRATQAGEIYRRLSSGHKIVLLTITRLVESVEERTLVLMDEPEVHLHPPLLAAFVRALSALLKMRNGVAIVATHSPVVLQEVPRHCVWILSRHGPFVDAIRPEIETFGENVGTLTTEVFGLEVSDSGFHRLLEEAADEFKDYSLALNAFEGQVGAEGRAILRVLVADALKGRRRP